MKKYSIYLKSWSLILFIFLSSCEKFVDVPPPTTRLVGESVYASDATAAAAISGIFQTIAGSSIAGGSYGFSAILGLTGDELTLYSASDLLYKEAFNNQLSSNSSIRFWTDLYTVLYQANVAIESLEKSTSLNPDIKSRLIGEAKFARAFCNFNLINLYGDVPFVTSTDYEKTRLLPRSPVSVIYPLIISDLLDAETDLLQNYVTAAGQPATVRVRPNKSAAEALLAKVYLYQQKWDSAEIYANRVIENQDIQLDTSLDKTFSSSSKEAIWQVEPPYSGFDAPDGVFTAGYFSGMPSDFYPIIISDNLLSAFDNEDKRRQKWIVSSVYNSVTYNFVYKFKYFYTGALAIEYPTFLRLSEQFLIRAEAKAHLQQIPEAVADLNIIRQKAGLPVLSITDQNELLDNIYTERQKELFAELGQRWFDMKRTGIIDSVMAHVAPLKGTAWKTEYQLLPIALDQLRTNQNLTQNPGYQ